MIVCTPELGDLKNGGFSKSKEAEEAALKLIAKRRGVSYSVDITEGKNTKWDGMLDGDPVEIKFSCKTFDGTPHRLGNAFETHYKSGDPSALLLTEAKYYITITPGWNAKHQMLTGKIRMWEVAELLRAQKIYPTVELAYGEYGFYVPNKSTDVKHTWLGDVLFDRANYSYDLSKWI